MQGGGIYKNQRDSTYPLGVNVRGVKLAFLNYTYGTNKNIARKPNIINYIDSLQILCDIQKKNALRVDFKIMTIHWGTEYELQANDIQRNLAQYFVDLGINLIVGSHPHVVQNAQILYSKDSVAVPVFYSLEIQSQINENSILMAGL